jgi:phosphate transport system permease protein
MAEAAMAPAGDIAPRVKDSRGVSRAGRNDAIFHGMCFSAAMVLMLTLAGLLVSLLFGGWPAIAHFGLQFFISSEWNPSGTADHPEMYGAAGPIVGTLVTSLLAMIMAVPLAIGIAVFLVEFCPKALANSVGMAVELLAGIPSIVYGMWGLFTLAPWFAAHVQTPLMLSLDANSFWGKLFAGIPNGANIFTASLILALMVLPYIASVFRELLLSVPTYVREAAYGMGCTPLEVVRSIMLPFIKRGAIGAVMLGLGRALGETMAVTFIIGNSHGFPDSLFASGSTIASTIANEFAEASGLHQEALVALGLVLFVITFTVLAAARMLIGKEKH